MTATPVLLGYGFVLGWSVAWPPGPINAELARRTLTRGFWPAFGLAVGATCGDTLWALLVALGVGVLLQGAVTRLALGVLSVALLLWLAFTFLRAAWLSATRAAVAAPRFESSRAAFVLGLTLALTSPWNIAFWLAAIGRPEIATLGFRSMLVAVGGVIAATLAWAALWCALVRLLRHAASGRIWDVTVRALTGFLMLYFAAATTLRLLGR